MCNKVCSCKFKKPSMREIQLQCFGHVNKILQEKLARQIPLTTILENCLEASRRPSSIVTSITWFGICRIITSC